MYLKVLKQIAKKKTCHDYLLKIKYIDGVLTSITNIIANVIFFKSVSMYEYKYCIRIKNTWVGVKVTNYEQSSC